MIKLEMNNKEASKNQLSIGIFKMRSYIIHKLKEINHRKKEVKTIKN